MDIQTSYKWTYKHTDLQWHTDTLIGQPHRWTSIIYVYRNINIDMDKKANIHIDGHTFRNKDIQP